jgi:hypothetical protein
MRIPLEIGWILIWFHDGLNRIKRWFKIIDVSFFFIQGLIMLGQIVCKIEPRSKYIIYFSIIHFVDNKEAVLDVR